MSMQRQGHQEAARGCPSACGGRSRADSTRGGPSAWRRSHGEEDSARGAAFGTIARHARWSRGRAGATQQHHGAVVLVTEVGGDTLKVRPDTAASSSSHTWTTPGQTHAGSVQRGGHATHDGAKPGLH
jgi:hypothetical protein